MYVEAVTVPSGVTAEDYEKMTSLHRNWPTLDAFRKEYPDKGRTLKIPVMAESFVWDGIPTDELELILG